VNKEKDMNYAAEYQSKLITAEQAAGMVKSGDWIDYGWATGTPYAIDQALAKRAGELTDVKLRGGILARPLAVFQGEDPGRSFTWNSFHCSGIERKYVSQGFGYYAPIRYSELPRYYRENVVPGDIAFLVTGPMDEFGFFNFGPNCSHLAAVCERAKKIVIEINENMPCCLGGFENTIHISKVDHIVEGENEPVPEMPGAPAGEVDQKVAELIVPEIPDGACLQLGIGGMPNAVGALIATSDLKDLGIHTEMYVDAFVDMSLAGKITGAHKNFDQGRQTFAFAAGTKKMYDFIHNNPEIMAAPVNYVNDVRNISRLDNFISINNAVDIDLFGQVNAESAGTKHISGAGGQLDFVMGAYLSKGGKSFICCSSTFKTKDGQLKSRIRPTLAEGSIVTDTRANTHWVVTEYGKANLKGLTTWQRAEALINLAHPDFRDELIREAEKIGIWRRSNRIG
jgi:butyryl-CoA:acetate CoA-transferase